MNDSYEDPDMDGLTNFQEYELGTDPTDADTDNDGAVDGADRHPLEARPDDAIIANPLLTIAGLISGAILLATTIQLISMKLGRKA